MTKFRQASALAAVCCALLWGSNSALASAINLPGNGSYEIYWGPSSSGNQSYGEIFTAPDSVLDDFSFTVYSDQAFPFVAQVYALNGTGPVGPALFTSPTQQTTTAPVQYTFTPNLSLTTANQYIAFVTNQPGGVSLGGSGFGYMEFASYDPSVYFNFAVGTPTTPANWACPGGCGVSVAFDADFSSALLTTTAPEPLTLSLFGAGLVSAAAMRRRRKA